MDVSTIILYFTPLIAFGATELAQKLVPAIQGAWTLFVMPALTILLNLIMGWIGMPEPFWIQLLLGVGSVFIDQLLKSLKVTS